VGRVVEKRKLLKRAVLFGRKKGWQKKRVGRKKGKKGLMEK
jgi:hypothetical protein